MRNFPADFEARAELQKMFSAGLFRAYFLRIAEDCKVVVCFLEWVISVYKICESKSWVEGARNEVMKKTFFPQPVATNDRWMNEQ